MCENIRKIPLSGILIIAVSINLAIGQKSAKDVISMAEHYINDPNIKWSKEWRQEYIETLHKVISDENADNTVKMDIIYRAFPSYWMGIKQSISTQTEFDMFEAELQWYCETLLEQKLSTKDEKEQLKSQISDFCNYAAEYLKGQFPFLKEQCIEESKKDALSRLEEQIDTPYIPLFRKPFSKEQIETAKALYMAMFAKWYSNWNRIKNETFEWKNNLNKTEINKHPQTKFVSSCLNSIHTIFWRFAEPPPQYYLQTVGKYNNERNKYMQNTFYANRSEMNMASTFSNQIEMAEHWSFIFTALLETGGSIKDTESLSVEVKKGGDGKE
jgi:hypothetical protein